MVVVERKQYLNKPSVPRVTVKWKGSDILGSQILEIPVYVLFYVFFFHRSRIAKSLFACLISLSPIFLSVVFICLVFFPLFILSCLFCLCCFTQTTIVNDYNMLTRVNLSSRRLLQIIMHLLHIYVTLCQLQTYYNVLWAQSCARLLTSRNNSSSNYILLSSVTSYHI